MTLRECQLLIFFGILTVIIHKKNADIYAEVSLHIGGA